MSADMFTPWAVREDKFPATAPVEDKLRFLLNYAIMAPSSHNTQPRRFKSRGNTLELYGDERRMLQVVDPNGREMIISCGAALLNLRVAVLYFGHRYEIEMFPIASNPMLLARLWVSDITQRAPSQEIRDLFYAIPERHTDRFSYQDRRIPDCVLGQLSEMLDEQDVDVRFFTEPPEKDRLVQLIVEGDTEQERDPAFRQELSSWMHPNTSDEKDGMPGYAFGVSTPVSQALPYFIRHFDLGRIQAHRDKARAMSAPCLALLSTLDDKPQDWLNLGQALEKMLLYLTDKGIVGSFLNQPIQVPHLRQRLREEMIPGGFPQILLRIGYRTRDAQTTPRRPVDDTLMKS